MTFSIVPMPTVIISKPDNSSSAAFFQGRPENEIGSFREIFGNALRTRQRDDTRTAAAEDKRMELVNRAEIKIIKSKTKDPEPVNVRYEIRQQKRK